jgi:hypothetical protein
MHLRLRASALAAGKQTADRGACTPGLLYFVKG